MGIYIGWISFFLYDNLPYTLKAIYHPSSHKTLYINITGSPQQYIPVNRSREQYTRYERAQRFIFFNLITNLDNSHLFKLS
jgi:hypothetical protein